MSKTWLITGCSSGFGKRLADAVAARGDNLIATARKVDELQQLSAAHPETVKTAALDVTEKGSAVAAVHLRRAHSAAWTSS